MIVSTCEQDYQHSMRLQRRHFELYLVFFLKVVIEFSFFVINPILLKNVN